MINGGGDFCFMILIFLFESSEFWSIFAVVSALC